MIIHAVGGKVVGMSPEAVRDFFTNDPEGVATATIAGDYADKVKVFSRWWKSPKSHRDRRGVVRFDYRREAPRKIPLKYKNKAFVPYHFLLFEGRIYQCRDYQDVGAHTPGYNRRSIAVGIIRDFWSQEPLNPEEQRALKNFITWACVNEPGLQVMTHDEAKKKPDGKPCPGVDVSKVVSWATRRAEIMLGRRSLPASRG